jgi:hypothetical protein
VSNNEGGGKCITIHSGVVIFNRTDWVWDIGFAMSRQSPNQTSPVKTPPTSGKKDHILQLIYTVALEPNSKMYVPSLFKDDGVLTIRPAKFKEDDGGKEVPLYYWSKYKDKFALSYILSSPKRVRSIHSILTFLRCQYHVDQKKRKAKMRTVYYMLQNRIQGHISQLNHLIYC